MAHLYVPVVFVTYTGFYKIQSWLGFLIMNFVGTCKKKSGQHNDKKTGSVVAPCCRDS